MSTKTTVGSIDGTIVFDRLGHNINDKVIVSNPRCIDTHKIKLGDRVRIDGEWYVVDGFVLGQVMPNGFHLRPFWEYVQAATRIATTPNANPWPLNDTAYDLISGGNKDGHYELCRSELSTQALNLEDHAHSQSDKIH